MHTITAIFLSPLLELREGAPLNVYDPAYYLDTYSGDNHRQEYSQWGEHVLLEYTDNIPQTLVDHLQSRPSFVEQYSPQKGKLLFVFQLPKEVKEKFTDKVLSGKYSEVDVKVADKYFPNDPNHFRYGNRLIIEKSDRWKEHWETKIGMSLPDGAEVYPRPLKRKEIYGYFENNSANTDGAGEQRTPPNPVL